MSQTTENTSETPTPKRRFAWEWLLVAIVVIGLVAMEGVPTAAFVIYQHDRNQAVERIFACRQQHGRDGADRSLIKWELEQNGAKNWRATAAKLESQCPR